MQDPQAIKLQTETKLHDNKIISSHIVGSQAYGLQTPQSDIDRIKLFTFCEHDLLSIKQPDATVIKKTEEGDLTFHEIGKWASLAAKGNPTMIELLYIPSELENKIWDQVIESRKLFLGKQSIHDAYFGYAMQQYTRIKNRGDGTFDSQTRNRTAKHARHLYRLMLQCKQFMNNQPLEVKLNDDDKAACFAFGQSAEDNDIDRLNKVFMQMKFDIDSLYDSCLLPERADIQAINNMVVRIRRNSLIRTGR